MFTKKPATRDSWKIYPMPDAAAERLDWQRKFSAEEYRLLKLGYIPEAPSDMWFAFFEDETFFIHLEHSGQCRYSFKITAGAEGYQSTDTMVHRSASPGSISDKERVVNSLDGIVNELLVWIKRTERPASRTDWQNTPMPDKKERLDITLVIPSTAYEKLRWGYIPRVMEDRWFYFMEDNWLYIHRSWTGYCIFQVKFEPDDGGYKVVEIWINRDPSQHYGGEEQAQDIILKFLQMHLGAHHL